MENLENKINTSEWIPVYGVYHVAKLEYQNKPSIMMRDDLNQKEQFLADIIWPVYQLASLVGLFYLGSLTV